MRHVSAHGKAAAEGNDKTREDVKRRGGRGGDWVGGGGMREGRRDRMLIRDWCVTAEHARGQVR